MDYGEFYAKQSERSARTGSKMYAFLKDRPRPATEIATEVYGEDSPKTKKKLTSLYYQARWREKFLRKTIGGIVYYGLKEGEQ